jgi:hypothetical protein
MGGGGAPPGQLAAYPTKVTDWHDAAVGDETLLSFDLVTAINDAKAFNPWTMLAPYNPATDLTDVKTALDSLVADAGDLDADADIESFIDQAAAKYDATVNSAANIAAMVTAHDNATETAYQRRASGFNVGMWLQGSFMTTQYAMGGAIIASERGYELARLRAQLDLQNLSARVQAITEIARMMLQERLATVQSLQASFGASFEYAKAKQILTDDYMEQQAEFNARRVTWDMSLISDGTATVMSILGSQLTPRALTGRERRAAAIGTAINTGLQFGGATNPGAGLLAGLGSLGISALQGAFNAK